MIAGRRVPMSRTPRPGASPLDARLMRARDLGAEVVAVATIADPRATGAAKFAPPAWPYRHAFAH